jgi:hypothetical protein
MGYANCSDAVNIRSAAGPDSQVVGTLYNNDEVYVESVDEYGWALIYANGVEGYVAGQYLSSSPNSNAAGSGAAASYTDTGATSSSSVDALYQAYLDAQEAAMHPTSEAEAQATADAAVAAYNAYVAGEDYNEYKTRIHYTLPFAFALGGFGFSFIGIALAIFLVWMLHKWARPIYDWNEMKAVLLHRNGTSWKRTALTWVNVAFFVLVAIIPLVILGIIIGILYLLGKSGIVDGLFNMVTGTMRGGGGSGVSSAFNSCDNCAHYGVGGDGKCWHGYSNPAGRCPYYSEK